MKNLLLALATLAFFLSGCTPAPKEPPPRSIKAIDDSVVATVKMNLKTDPTLAASTIEVKAENELLVLQGQVPSQEAKDKAEELAKKAPKVEKVANHLEVVAP